MRCVVIWLKENFRYGGWVGSLEGTQRASCLIGRLRFLRWIEWKFQDFKIRKAIESWTEDLGRINVNIQVYYLFCTPIG